MQLALTSDYITSEGDPFPYLEAIARAGFSHVQWCHEWNTDFVYERTAIRAIKDRLRSLALSLRDLHATQGHRVNWISPDASIRAAGVNLVRNRLEMTAELGGSNIVMHLPWFGGWLEPACRALDELQRLAGDLGIRIALENLGNDQNWRQLTQLLERYPSDYLGLCYDSGHGNLCPGSLEMLDCLKHRLLVLHLHDNDRSGDQHLVPFHGSVNWAELMRIIARSSYDGFVSLESVKGGHDSWDDVHFLNEAYGAGARLTDMVETERASQ